MMDFKRSSGIPTNIALQPTLDGLDGLLDHDYENLPRQTADRNSQEPVNYSDQLTMSPVSFRDVSLGQLDTNPYKEKYLELLNKQLEIIRQQKLQQESRSQPLALAYSPAHQANSPVTNKNRFQLGTILAFWATAVLIPIILFWGIFNESIVYGLGESEQAHAQVAGVSETKGQFQLDVQAYDSWIRQLTGLSLSQDNDLDGDGLSNAEEFILNTDPKNQFTCNGEKNDLENLLSLIDPISCQKMDLENAADLAKYEQVVHVPTIAQKMFTFQDAGEDQTQVGNSLFEVFGVDDLSKIDLSRQGDLQREIELSKKREEYSQIILKIDQYVAANRSYEEYDREHATPVSSAIFLETSIKYDVPLKYVLTVARLESRFGTDRYTRSGNLTRPGAHQNMYSIGLDDSGNNKTYSSWEDGVYGFGRWYRYFDDKGVEDCRKWRIYNPNGDYCAKVEQYAAEVQVYIYG